MNRPVYDIVKRPCQEVSPLEVMSNRSTWQNEKINHIIMAQEVGPSDILCGRTSDAFNNIGNRRFRITIGLNLKRYRESTNRQEKTNLVASIVHLLRNEVGARFLRKTANGYEELREKQCKEKVGHAFRDMAGPHCSTSKEDCPKTTTNRKTAALTRKSKGKQHVATFIKEGVDNIKTTGQPDKAWIERPIKSRAHSSPSKGASSRRRPDCTPLTEIKKGFVVSSYGMEREDDLEGRMDIYDSTENSCFESTFLSMCETSPYELFV
jgi:hypothetical protein